MIYLDTNVVVWLAANEQELLSNVAKEIIESAHTLYISPMVMLELRYLQEVKRLTKQPKAIKVHLEKYLGLRVCEKDFNTVTHHALDLSWTRDPFDRIITAQASLDNNVLITKDKTILANYEYAAW